MTDVVLKLSEKNEGKSKEEILKLLDQEVDRFSTFMANLPDQRVAGALIQGERHLLKTYLVHKLNGKLDEAS